MKNQQKKFKVAVYGAGNVGTSVLRLLTQTRLFPDIEAVAVVRRKNTPVAGIDVPVVTDLRDIKGAVDAVIYAGPSQNVPEDIPCLLEAGFCTVDSYDDHGNMEQTLLKLNAVAGKCGVTAVVGAGWNPGTDSVFKIYMNALIPGGGIETVFGPGGSKGHGTAVRKIEGVVDAVSLTLPAEEFLQKKGYQDFPAPASEKPAGKHLRDVYIVAEGCADKQNICDAVRFHSYFKDDPTRVTFVTSEELAGHNSDQHGGILRTKSDIGSIEKRSHGNNAMMTACVLLAAARACVRSHRRRRYRALTLAHIAPIDLQQGTTEKKRFNEIHY